MMVGSNVADFGFGCENVNIGAVYVIFGRPTDSQTSTSTISIPARASPFAASAAAMACAGVLPEVGRRCERRRI